MIHARERRDDAVRAVRYLAGHEERIVRDLDGLATACDGFLIVQSEEGEVRADVGDWLVRTESGVYPIADALFRSRFELLTVA